MGIKEKDATWFSYYTTILSRAFYGLAMDEYGQMWVGGWVQIRIFAQQCRCCLQYVTVELDEKEIIKFSQWLHRWIAKIFYKIRLPSKRKIGSEIGSKNDKPHCTELCEACHAGWCSYLWYRWDENWDEDWDENWDEDWDENWDEDWDENGDESKTEDYCDNQNID